MRHYTICIIRFRETIKIIIIKKKPFFPFRGNKCVLEERLISVKNEMILRKETGDFNIIYG